MRCAVSDITDDCGLYRVLQRKSKRVIVKSGARRAFKVSAFTSLLPIDLLREREVSNIDFHVA